MNNERDVIEKNFIINLLKIEWMILVIIYNQILFNIDINI